MTVSAPEKPFADQASVANRPLIALVGSPNTGKTSLFNSLTGLRAKTGNFSGTTVEKKLGRLTHEGREIDVVDLPGLYSLSAATEEEKVAREVILGQRKGISKPDPVVIVADADNIERSLFVVSQLAELGIPRVVALNMMDVAERHGIHVDVDALSKELSCPVVVIDARTGKGTKELIDCIDVHFADSSEEVIEFQPAPAACNSCGSCPYQSRYSWSDDVTSRCVTSPRVARSGLTEKLDKVTTHPVLGVAAFLAVMLSVFYLIFSVASIPMDLIDHLFSGLGGWVSSWVPEGDLQSLLVDGVIGGVGGILIFLPQICILFFFLALLEDTGYLSRAAFVMDRLMRRIGLPGTAFVPLLSAHACAIPAIMATRVIRDPRDRLVTILVAPLMTCSARIPVYAMVTALLFPERPGMAALVFTGAYSLGIFAALIMAFVFKKTILPGESKPLALELPGYRIPNLKTSLLYTYDRSMVFVKQAGSIILLISIGLWVLATFPKSDEPEAVVQMQTQAEVFRTSGAVEAAEALDVEAENLFSQYSLENSFAGMMGKAIEPIMRPLGYDWQISIGVLTSFAAREVIVSTLAIVYGMGDTGEEGLHESLRQAKRADGSPVFTVATSISLLIFYVLAMQCLPTQAVTKRETNSWKWPIFQLVYMTVLAYGSALIAYQAITMLGG